MRSDKHMSFQQIDLDNSTRQMIEVCYVQVLVKQTVRRKPQMRCCKILHRWCFSGHISHLSHLQVSIIDAADLPVGILAGAKPKLLLPPEPPEVPSDSGEAVAPPPQAPTFGRP